MDIPLRDAMICWDRETGTAGVVLHPDVRRDSKRFASTVGACSSNWRERTHLDRKLLLMIEAWHAVTFDDIPPAVMHEALLVIPEYRSTLAGDCLPERFRQERD